MYFVSIIYLSILLKISKMTAFCNIPGRAINLDVLCESGRIGTRYRLKTDL